MDPSLFFAEARHGNGSNLCSDRTSAEIMVRRSTDDGRSWSDHAVAAGGPDNPIGNPCPIALRSGRIVLVYVRHALQCASHDCGTDTRGNGAVFSEDDGLTWTPERDISADFGPAAGGMPGPGAGVELQGSGRLLVASHMGPYVAVLVTFSDDGGETWRCNPRAFFQMDEAALADLGDGNVMVNMRHRLESQIGRAVARSHDGGLTWGEIEFDPALEGPVCQGSLAKIGGHVYFSNSRSSSDRIRLSVRRSDDEGRRWGRVLQLQEEWSWGYSSLVQAPMGTHGDQIGILYEAVNPVDPSTGQFVEVSGGINFQLIPADLSGVPIAGGA